MKSLLRHLWAGWKKFAHLLGTFNRIVLLTVFYWVFVDLANLGLRLLRVDLLNRRWRRAESYWRPKPKREKTYQHQF